MIPQAIANVGPYADLWSHLKSMQHALLRANAAQNARDLSMLDKERLTALAFCAALARSKACCMDLR